MKLSGEPFSSSLLVRYATATWNSLGLTTGVYSKSEPTLFFTWAERCCAIPCNISNSTRSATSLATESL